LLWNGWCGGGVGSHACHVCQTSSPSPCQGEARSSATRTGGDSKACSDSETKARPGGDTKARGDCDARSGKARADADEDVISPRRFHGHTV